MSSYIDARPDWFEVIHLYGTKSGWARLKELVEAHEDSVARHRTFVDRIAPAARNIHAYWLAHPAPRERLRQLNKAPAPGRNDPCPCGSGKKFKRCQGAPDVAVFGLTPAKYQSGENDRTGAISRCGDEMMRIMLYEAAQSMLVRTAKWSWLKAWAMKIARHRGMKKAIVALARRLAVIMHRMWVDGTEFRWTRELPVA